MRVNRASGVTTSYELGTPEGAGEWAGVQRDPQAQRDIRGVLLDGDAKCVAVQTPRQFGQVAFAASLECNDRGEQLGERLEVQADDVRLTVTVLKSGMVRVLLTRPGKARHLSQFARR